MNEENVFKVSDVRMQRPILVRVEEKNLNMTLQMSEFADISGSVVNFPSPNNVSIFLSSARKEISKSNSIYKSLFGKIHKSKNKRFRLVPKDVSRLYNYFESIQVAIVSMYTAIESFANVSIPGDFVYEKLNQKGIKESYTKESIERHIATSEKIDKILPIILKCDSPKGTKLWQDFKELESLRNEIIHPKTTTRKTELKEDSSFLCNLLADGFINKISSGFSVISYFCDKDTSNSLFPMGFGEVKIEPIPWSENLFEKVEFEGDEIEL